MAEKKQNPELVYFRCPICEKDDFNSLREMMKHMDIHNAKDPEINISVVAEREAFLDRLFG
jgi:predicted aconitase